MIKIQFPKIGMRKVKSALALLLAFLVWQLIRIGLPWLDLHPGFAYMYAVIEMRADIETTMKNGFARIKATIIGLIFGLIAIYIFENMGVLFSSELLRISAEAVIMGIGVIITIGVSQMADCQPLCAIGAVVFLVCVLWHVDADRYLYAIIRTAQTLLGIMAAFLINYYIKPVHKNVN